MTRVVTAKIPEHLVREIDEVSKYEHIDRSTAMRKLLLGAVKEWKEARALEQYSEGKLSLERAAHYADCTVWDFFDLLRKHKIPLQIDVSELHYDLDAVKKWKR